MNDERRSLIPLAPAAANAARDLLNHVDRNLWPATTN